MIYKILFDKRVLKDLKKIPKTDQKKIVACIEEELAHDPYRGKRLAGELSDLYCYRIGKYRIVYTIDDDKIIVEVVRIGHRKDIYEKLKR